jgi:hypothetical protein
MNTVRIKFSSECQSKRPPAAPVMRKATEMRDAYVRAADLAPKDGAP